MPGCFSLQDGVLHKTLSLRCDVTTLMRLCVYALTLSMFACTVRLFVRPSIHPSIRPSVHRMDDKTSIPSAHGHHSRRHPTDHGGNIKYQPTYVLTQIPPPIHPPTPPLIVWKQSQIYVCRKTSRRIQSVSQSAVCTHMPRERKSPVHGFPPHTHPHTDRPLHSD